MSEASRGAKRRGGFVLVLTLFMLAIIATTAVAVLSHGRAGLIETEAVYQAARRRAIADAAIVRATYALPRNDDALKLSMASEARPAAWRFEGTLVELSAEPESGKIDLNAARPDLIAAAARSSSIGPDMVSAVENAVALARSQGRIIPGVRSVAPPCGRQSLEAGRLERRFTVLTRLAGVTPDLGSQDDLDLIPSITPEEKSMILNSLRQGRSPTDDRRLARLRPYLSDGASIYTLVAKVRAGDGAPVLSERSSTLSLHVGTPRIRAVTTKWRIDWEFEFC